MNPDQWGVYTAWGKKLRFSTEIAVYLRNSKRQVHAYCGSSLIGSRI